jgi:hypothetical protein
LIQRLVPARCGGDDGIGIGFPSEGLSVSIVLGEVAVDCGLEVDDAEEGVRRAAAVASFSVLRARRKVRPRPDATLLGGPH